MPELAACYFCGTTDGAESVRLGGGATATLCPDCRAKLETVLEAVEGGGTPSGDPSSSDGRPTAGDPEAGSGAPSTAGASDVSADSSDEGGTDANDEVGAEASPVNNDAGDAEVSALEHNKVVRLLENREFPVDRDEFVAVAANAYQVDHADCDRVIDAAIEEGLIAEEDGRLVRPETG